MSPTCRALILLAAILLRPGQVGAAEAPPEWSRAQRDVRAALLQNGASLADLVKQVSRSKPTSGQEAMFNLCVLTRAGIRKDSRLALQDIKRICPQLSGGEVSNIYYDACDYLQAWDVALATVEIFAENIDKVDLQNRLLKHLLSSGWSIDRVDEWLASQSKGTNSFWVKERFRFNGQNGRGPALAKKFADRVRANPQDVHQAKVFLEALTYASLDPQATPDLAWMSDVIKPQLATDALEIASRLVVLRAPRTAVVFYRQAVASQLTADEIRNRQRTSQVGISEAATRAQFAIEARKGLAECLLLLQESDEAQKWMLEAADIRQQNGVGRDAFFAGRVQGATGGREIEQQIKAEEKASENDPKYWQNRALYYHGRNEPTQEEAALKKGLALTKPQPPPERPGKGSNDWRSTFLSRYARFLMEAKRQDEAVALLRKELAESPAIAVSTEQAAGMLISSDFKNHIRAGDELLWAWLENREKWKYTEERLLWQMLESANPHDSDLFARETQPSSPSVPKNLATPLARAEKLAMEGDPSRASVLGWIENRLGYPQRSLPLLERAVEKIQDKELKERASFSLFESCLDSGDWKRAEAIFPTAAGQLTLGELPVWYSRIAVLAAKAGAKDDAMRIWKRVANLDLTATGAVDQLVDAGLRDDLIDFYRGIQTTIPSSGIPPKMLAALGEHDAGRLDQGDSK